MTIKKVEIVSVTVPEWDLLERTLQLLWDIATSTDKNTPIHQKAIEAGGVLETLKDAIDEICGC